MLLFNNFQICVKGLLLGYQYDNLTRTLDVQGDIPSGWDWVAMVQIGNNFDIIPLTATETGLSATLTADNLSITGYYTVQLKATQGELVQHTNVVQTFVGASLSGDAKWPTIPTEFTQLEQRVQASAAEAQASAEAAAQSAQDAETAAQDAADQTAQQLQSAFEALAKEVSDSAQSAEASAQSASTAAGSADQSASAAWASANQAAASAQSAAAASSAAAQSASGAIAAAGTAQSAATQAQQSAESAGQQAQTAGDHAADADQSAKSAADAQVSAETAAGNAEQSANAAAQSAQEADAAAENAKTIIDDTTAQLGKTWSSLTIVDRLAPAFESSGPVVTCNPVEGYPLHVVSQIVPVQEGEGDPSPDNVRPIKGWAEANLWVGGANIINAFDELIIPQDRYSFSISSGNLFDAIKSLPRGKTLYMSWDDVGTNYDQGTSNMISFYNGGHSAGFKIQKNVAFIIPTDGIVYTQLLCYAGTNKTQDAVWSNFRCGPTLESVADYVPYNPASKTITLPFGQVVYGGTLDWTTGVLTVGSIFLKLDTTYSIGLYQFQDKNGVFFSSPLLYSPSRIEGVCSHGICTTYPSISSESWIWIGANNPLVYWIGVLDVLGLSTVDEFKSWLDTQDVQIVYPMQEPVTIQLTPQEILALSGTNTIYTDTGDTTVSGRADPNAIIQQLAARIAALEGAAINL
ncbi:hypothetical protein [uncultured Flavonifractor sp.]|uniref:hypothetical protein n=1 Tax=uncultured Flavonifractor sp. TaxID=1193534 RepID=UPI00260E224C|nr:hypothetical protein [uncultured Flavonifractor sp.]